MSIICGYIFPFSVKVSIINWLFIKKQFFLKFFINIGTILCYEQYTTQVKVQFLCLPTSFLSDDIGYMSFHFKMFSGEQKYQKPINSLLDNNKLSSVECLWTQPRYDASSDLQVETDKTQWLKSG